MKTAVKKTNDWANFILRRIEKGVETDTMLGGYYSYIEKEQNSDVFDDITKEWSTDDL
jgi:hypothetical protein